MRDAAPLTTDGMWPRRIGARSSARTVPVCRPLTGYRRCQRECSNLAVGGLDQVAAQPAVQATPNSNQLPFAEQVLLDEHAVVALGRCPAQPLAI